MGHVYVDAEIVNPENPEFRVKTKALIDTGATHTVIPERIPDGDKKQSVKASRKGHFKHSKWLWPTASLVPSSLR